MGTSAAYFAELFGVRLRFSGTAVGIQVGLIISGFSPAIASAWLGGRIENWTTYATIIVGLGARRA